MKIFPFQAQFPNLDIITSPDSFFGTVKEQYREYAESGFFSNANHSSYYVYQIKSPNNSHLGLIACADMEEFLAGNIKKHEKTLAAKEQRQIQLLMRRRAAVKPVLLTFPNVAELDTLLQSYLQKPVAFEIDFEVSQEQHFFWEVTDKNDAQKIERLFAEQVPTAYIADGHHRLEATSLLYQKRDQGHNDQTTYRHLYCTFFPISELQIWDFNRVIEAFDTVSIPSFMAQLSEYMKISVLKKAKKPNNKHQITMFLQGEWFLLEWKKSVIKKHKKNSHLLDVALFNDLIVNKIIGIEDVRSTTRITYVEGAKGTLGIVKTAYKMNNAVGFCLPPVLPQEFLELSESGMMLPPKSTWFEPRIKNGVVVKPYNER